MTKICSKCNAEIKPGDTAVSLGEDAMHQQCFSCDHCHAPISGQFITAEDNKQYHSQCYADSFAPECKLCSDKIVGEDALVLADSTRVHSRCFKCHECQKVLRERYTEQAGQYFHKECYAQKYAPKCQKCTEVLEGAFVEYDGMSYHKKCLCCHYCGCSVAGIRFQKTIDAHLQCQDCHISAQLARSKKLSEVPKPVPAQPQSPPKVNQDKPQTPPKTDRKVPISPNSSPTSDLFTPADSSKKSPEKMSPVKVPQSPPLTPKPSASFVTDSQSSSVNKVVTAPSTVSSLSSKTAGLLDRFKAQMASIDLGPVKAAYQSPFENLAPGSKVNKVINHQIIEFPKVPVDTTESSESPSATEVQIALESSKAESDVQPENVTPELLEESTKALIPPPPPPPPAVMPQRREMPTERAKITHRMSTSEAIPVPIKKNLRPLSVSSSVPTGLLSAIRTSGKQSLRKVSAADVRDSSTPPFLRAISNRSRQDKVTSALSNAVKRMSVMDDPDSLADELRLKLSRNRMAQAADDLADDHDEWD